MAKILIVDDDPDFVETTRLVLESAGHEVITAADGDAGIRSVEKDSPDMVILDIIMASVLDGLSVSARMADNPAWRDIPILMVTSIANSDYAALFPTDEYIHIDAFVSKPISPDVLLSRTQSLLRRVV
jgi:CheY-like chemotaxis protein